MGGLERFQYGHTQPRQGGLDGSDQVGPEAERGVGVLMSLYYAKEGQAGAGPVEGRL